MLALGCEKDKVGPHTLQVRTAGGYGDTWTASGAGFTLEHRTGNFDTTFTYDKGSDCVYVGPDYPSDVTVKARIDDNAWEYTNPYCYQIVVCIEDKNHVACPTQ